MLTRILALCYENGTQFNRIQEEGKKISCYENKKKIEYNSGKVNSITNSKGNKQGICLQSDTQIDCVFEGTVTKILLSESL